jgi:hypothetical protein
MLPGASACAHQAHCWQQALHQSLYRVSATTQSTLLAAIFPLCELTARTTLPLIAACGLAGCSMPTLYGSNAVTMQAGAMRPMIVT